MAREMSDENKKMGSLCVAEHTIGVRALLSAPEKAFLHGISFTVFVTTGVRIMQFGRRKEKKNSKMSNGKR